MDRRSFIQSCFAGSAAMLLPALPVVPVWQAVMDSTPHHPWECTTTTLPRSDCHWVWNAELCKWHHNCGACS